MKVSYKWLQEFVNIDISPRELADRLTLAGITVEGVKETGEGVSKVITGQIDSISRHPNADKLVVTSVNIGTEKLQIVTAATNVREGDIIPVAVEGAKLASGLAIKRAKLRGVESRGMMCSGQELGIDPKTMSAEQASGIMILPPGARIGEDAKEILGLDDYILELDLTPNRGDCLSIIGVAREVAALLGKPFRLPQPSFGELDEKTEGQVKVDILDRDLCRRFVGRLIKNVRIGSSPLWMQQRLRAAGMRPINNIVDVTNYVMLELGQPMHAFDYNLLQDGHIIVRRVREGEKIITLDGAARDLTPGMLAITDPSGPIAIAGVMGGQSTEVTDKTESILLESAFFNPVSVRRTSKALGLRSEASLRFEKGIDIGGCARAADRAAQLIVEMGSGEASAGRVDRTSETITERVVQFRPSRASYVLGVDIPGETARDILTSLQFKVQDANGDLLVTIPTHRVDVSLEVDLIEEVARMYGYDKAPETLPFGKSTGGMKTIEQAYTTRVRSQLAASGLFEVMTYSFVHPRVFDLMNLPAGSPYRNTLNIQNPLSEEHSVMRTMLLPCLMEVLVRNYNRRVQNGAVFEMGRVFVTRGLDTQPEEKTILAAAAMGCAPGSWNLAPAAFDYYYLKGVLENLFSALRTAPVTFRPESADPSFHPGRTAVLEADGVRLGILGELHPDVLEKYELPVKVTAFELDFNQLLALSGQPADFIPLPKYPGIERDLAVLVKKDIPAEGIFAAIREAGGKLLSDVSLFDIYSGEQVPDGMQSMAFSLKFQAVDRTLTDAEAVEMTNAIAGALAGKFGAELRS
ncbi:MAG: phenylalanine--tRNA ligase subunit beta [Desulfotomaculaceae bacterium]|nr:phenylalanine--tRNA ligase subunit beta [Desulfotomaculaceae bacterium]MDD4766503.1 phenylalanine--tRNA ligase subunit beta [Desulfotomaculaceae bacterium]